MRIIRIDAVLTRDGTLHAGTLFLPVSELWALAFFCGSRFYVGASPEIKGAQTLHRMVNWVAEMQGLVLIEIIGVALLRR